MTAADLTPDERDELEALKATRRQQQPGTEAWYEAHRAFLTRHQDIIYAHRNRGQGATWADGYQALTEVSA